MKAPTVTVKNNKILNCEGHNWNTLFSFKVLPAMLCKEEKRFVFLNNNISNFDHVIQIQF